MLIGIMPKTRKLTRCFILLTHVSKLSCFDILQHWIWLRSKIYGNNFSFKSVCHLIDSILLSWDFTLNRCSPAVWLTLTLLRVLFQLMDGLLYFLITEDYSFKSLSFKQLHSFMWQINLSCLGLFFEGGLSMLDLCCETI